MREVLEFRWKNGSQKRVISTMEPFHKGSSNLNPVAFTLDETTFSQEITEIVKKRR